MKLYLSVLFLLFVCLDLQAQHQLSGRLVSEESVPIEFASVIVYPLSDSTAVTGGISQKDGSFVLADLDPDSYKLTVQMLGYEDWKQVLEISESLDLSTITLKREVKDLATVEVVAEQSLVESHLGKKVLRIGKDLSSTGSSALEALEVIPSVSTTDRGQVQIRGNSNVVIYINGKETRRESSSLKYISAESLEKIEIITNPSAKYDAEGVGGIINIVYKKGRTGALKIELISTLSLATNPLNLSPSAGMNLSWTKRKYSIYSNVSQEYGRYQDKVHSGRVHLTDSLEGFESSMRSNGLGTISNALLGFSMAPDSSSSISLEVNYDRWDLEMDNEQVQVFDYRNAERQTVATPNQRLEVEDELWINLSLEKEFEKEQVLQASLTAGGENEQNSSSTEPLDFANLPVRAQQFLQSSDEQESQRYLTGKIDYEWPISEWGTIEAGLKADFVRYDMLQEIVLRSDTIAVPDNDFDMEMRKLGAFLLHKHSIGNLEFAFGLRLEQFVSESQQRADQSSHRLQYRRLFPSAQLNYLFRAQEQTLGLSYTKRIKRPGFFDLNPYISYEDPLNLETGNPLLEPEIANLFELNFHQEWNSVTMDMSLYHRTTKQSIQSILQGMDNNRTLASRTNIGSELSQGLEAQVEWRPNQRLKTSATFLLAQNNFEAPENEISYDKRSTYSIALKQELRLKGNWKLELSETYRAPSYQMQEQSHEVFYINFGAQRKFKDGRGAFTVSVRDILNTREYVVSLSRTDLEVQRTYKWQTRQIAIGLKYVLVDRKH